MGGDLRSDLHSRPNPASTLQTKKTHIGTLPHSRSDRRIRTLGLTQNRITLQRETKPRPYGPPLSSNENMRRTLDNRLAHRPPPGVSACRRATIGICGCS